MAAAAQHLHRRARLSPQSGAQRRHHQGRARQPLPLQGCRRRGLVASFLAFPSSSPSTVAYLKPLQTGYPDDSDARFVFHRAPALLRRLPLVDGTTRLVASNHTLFPSPSVDPLHSAGAHPTTAADALYLLAARVVGTLS
ncbi:Os03g0555000 [Oryza sativa Japonica Group]|uniref:Os03g0555000 protein n=1 Tax=Oryza sativa subsp. japonica TaxID=39947 RepID=A0A0P0VZY2_ORYSJ|nr:Os03g0555000 [Oryza sativa Japonica Group]